MNIEPRTVLLALGVGLVILLIVRHARLLIELVLGLAKLAIVLLLILLIGWAFGLWPLPSPVLEAFSGLRALLEPIPQWISGLL